MANIIDMESPEFELVILRAMVKCLISMHQENQLGHLPYSQIEANIITIEKDMITVKGNMLTKTDMHDVFAEMLPKIVAAIKQS